MNRRCWWFVLFVVVPLLAYAASFSWMPDKHLAQPRTGEPTFGLRIDLTPAEQTVAVGQNVSFDVAITNLGPDPMEIVRPLDGSEARWQQPYHDFLAERVDGVKLRWTMVGGRPAKMNALSRDDVIHLKKDDKVDPRTGSAADYLKKVKFDHPGVYRVWYLYVFERVSNARNLNGEPYQAQYVNRGVYTSNAVTVTVTGP